MHWLLQTHVFMRATRSLLSELYRRPDLRCAALPVINAVEKKIGLRLRPPSRFARALALNEALKSGFVLTSMS